MEDTTIKHICGRCSDEWLTEQEYLAHTCPTTGFNPTEPDHQGPEFVEVQKAALSRGLDQALSNNDTEQADKNQAALDALAPTA